MLGNVGFLPLMWIPFATALIDGSDPHSMTESPATLQVLLRNLPNSSRCWHGLRIPQILIWLSTIDHVEAQLWIVLRPEPSRHGHRTSGSVLWCLAPLHTPGRSFDSWGRPGGVSIVWTDSIRLRSRESWALRHIPWTIPVQVLQRFRIHCPAAGVTAIWECCRQSSGVLWSPLKSSDQFKTEQHCESLA